MKRFVLMLLVIGAVAQPLRVAGIHMLYRVNGSFIISQCKQRHEPCSGCEGKNHFQKQLKNDPQHGQRLPVSFKLSAQDLLPLPEAFRLMGPALPRGRQAAHMALNLPVYTPCPIADIFHPPRCKACTFFYGVLLKVGIYI